MESTLSQSKQLAIQHSLHTVHWGSQPILITLLWYSQATPTLPVPTTQLSTILNLSTAQVHTLPIPTHCTPPTLPLPTYHPQPIPMPDVHPQYTRSMVSREPYKSQQKFFRPWEDTTDSLESGGTACCSHKDCGGTADHHSQSGSRQEQVRQDLVPFSEADFPALSSELYKLKIEK
eukprot:GFUD01018903.1.p2 GENE.GFUD01018903.1~~GFUD01018903.1.p2  ORF type:complete len:176 (+),score=41.45 GFUD01018903.1:431-958(+)